MSNEKIDVSPWLYQSEILSDEKIPEKSIGFIYKITHKETGKFYYGRKMLTSSSFKMVNGKKKRVRKANDWGNYWGSSDLLLEDVKTMGKDKFTREILIFCETKACMIISEEYVLHVTGSLFDPLCYNNNIRAKIFRKWFVKTPNFFNDLREVKL